jgi:hypothetical protein
MLHRWSYDLYVHRPIYTYWLLFPYKLDGITLSWTEKQAVTQYIPQGDHHSQLTVYLTVVNRHIYATFFNTQYFAQCEFCVSKDIQNLHYYAYRPTLRNPEFITMFIRVHPWPQPEPTLSHRSVLILSSRPRLSVTSFLTNIVYKFLKSCIRISNVYGI